MRVLGLHLGRLPGELRRLRVPVRPRREGEVPFPRPADVGEFHEVLQVVGQGVVDRGERGVGKRATSGTILGQKQVVAEIELWWVEAEFREFVGTPQKLEGAG